MSLMLFVMAKGNGRAASLMPLLAVADAAAAEVVEAFDVVGCRRASWAGAFLTILPILSSVVLIRAWRS